MDPSSILGAVVGTLATLAFGLADPTVVLALAGCAAAVGTVYALARMYLHDQHQNHIPRGYSDAKFVAGPVKSNRPSPNRDGFSKKKPFLKFLKSLKPKQPKK